MKFVYFNLKNHPRGNIILQDLLNNNLIPCAIIEEKSSLAVKNCEGILSVFKNSSEKFPLTNDLILQRDIPFFEVDNHNDLQCEKILKQLGDIDLIVLGDTRIIKKNILNIPKIGIINSHPGYLPDVRGNNPYIWAIINDLPQGCSVHFIDEGVDTGDIILREMINLSEYNSYINLLKKINSTCANLIVQAVLQIKNNNFSRTPQANLKFVGKNIYNAKEFFASPEEVKKLAIKKMES